MTMSYFTHESPHERAIKMKKVLRKLLEKDRPTERDSIRILRLLARIKELESESADSQ